MKIGLTNLLVNAFVKNSEDVESPAARTAYGKFAGIVGIVCNVLLCLGKGAVGLLAGSVSIVADAVNNLSDASSNVISLIGFRLASKPADREHPYGHGRYEYLSGMMVSVLIVVIGVELVKSSVEKILNPEPTELSWVVVGVLLASIVVKLWMMAFNANIGARISSATLKATAADSRNDVITTAAVLAAALVSAWTGVDLDGWAGAAVGVFIVVSGIGLVKDTMNPLLGNAPDPALVRHIREKILSYPGVLGTHDLMVHDYGPGRQFASAHVEMAAETDPMVSHDLIDNIEQDFLHDDGLVMTIHYDPIVTTDEALHSVRHEVEEIVRGIDGRLSIHDVRTVPGPTHTNLIFDCAKPHDVPMSDADLRRAIVERVEARLPGHVCKVTIDDDYVSACQ